MDRRVEQIKQDIQDIGSYLESWKIEKETIKKWERIKNAVLKDSMDVSDKMNPWCLSCLEEQCSVDEEHCEMIRIYLKAKGSANFNINQQTHGGQSVSQPAPNCLTATSPC